MRFSTARNLKGRGTHFLPAAALLALGLLTLPASGAAPRAAAPAPDAYLRELIPPAPTLHAALKDDERLTKPVTIAMGDVPMADLLAELAKLSGVPLSASADVADEMVIAGFKDRQLGNVLTLLSTHFGFTWRKKAGGYELWQDLASKNREEALRNGAAIRLVALAVRLGKLAEQPSGLLRERLKAAREASQDSRLTPAARRQLDAETRELMTVSRADTQFVLRLLSRMPTQRLQQFVITGQLDLSLAGGEIRAADAVRWQDERAEEAQISGRPAGPLLRTFDSLVVEHRMQGIEGESGAVSDINSVIRNRSGGVSSVFSSNLSLPPEPEAALPRLSDERLRKEIGVITQSRRFRGSFRSGPYLDAWQKHTDYWPDSGVGAADLLLALHRATKLDVVSDEFDPRAPMSQSSRLQPGTTFEQGLSYRVGYGAAIDAGVLRVRHGRFFHLRPRAVPARIIRAAARRITPDAGAFLDALVDVAGSLTPRQQSTLTSAWGYLWGDSELFIPAPNTHDQRDGLELAALLSRLSAGTRKRLLTGAPLPLRSLPGSDSAVIEARMANLSRKRVLPPPLPDPAAGPPVALQLMKSDLVRRTYVAYGPDGKRSFELSGAHPLGEPERPHPGPIQGLVPTLVGSPSPETRYGLELVDGEKRRVRSLAQISLLPPTAYQVSASPPDGANPLSGNR